MTLIVASTSPAFGADSVILGSYLVAAAIFAAAWGIQLARGKSPRLGWRSSAAEEIEDFPPLQETTDSPPVTAPPALPAVTPEQRGRFKVDASHFGFIDLPLIGLVFLLFFFLTSTGGAPDETPPEEKYTASTLVGAIFVQLVIMGMVVAFVSWRVKISEWLGLRWRLWPLAFAIAPVTVFCMWLFLGAMMFSGWNQWLENTLGIESMQDTVKLLQKSEDPAVLALMAVAAVLVAPLAEEVVFRGYLYAAAKRFCGIAGSVLFSSLVFAAAHGNVVALLPLFVLAVLLCLIYEFTGSIWACISVHFLFNAATVGIQFLARSGVIELPVET